jgi:hypothetical protein
MFLKFLEFAVHYFIYVDQLGPGLVRKTYNDNDNTFIHLFTVLTIAICCEFRSCQLTENDTKQLAWINKIFKQVFQQKMHQKWQNTLLLYIFLQVCPRLSLSEIWGDKYMGVPSSPKSGGRFPRPLSWIRHCLRITYAWGLGATVYDFI